MQTLSLEGQAVQVGKPVVRIDRVTIKHLEKEIISSIVSTGSGTIVWRASGTIKAGRDVLFALEI